MYNNVCLWPSSTLKLELLENFYKPAERSTIVNEEGASELLEGITASQLQFSQVCVNGNLVAVEYLRPVTTCRIEMDTMSKEILNQHMAQMVFGHELWEEEKRRREAAGMSLESPLTPPYTNTNHRVPEQHEIQLRERLQSLRRKGELLVRGFEPSADEAPWLTQHLNAVREGVGSDALLALRYTNTEESITPMDEWLCDIAEKAPVDQEGVDSDEEDEQAEVENILLSQNELEHEVMEERKENVLGSTTIEHQSPLLSSQTYYKTGKYSQKPFESIGDFKEVKRMVGDSSQRRSLLSVFSTKKRQRVTFDPVLNPDESVDFSLRNNTGPSPRNTTSECVVEAAEGSSNSSVQCSLPRTQSLRGSAVVLRISLDPPKFQYVKCFTEGSKNFYPKLFYSNPADRPCVTHDSNHDAFSEMFTLDSLAEQALHEGFQEFQGSTFLLPSFTPPSRLAVSKYLLNLISTKKYQDSSQIETPIKSNTLCAPTNRHDMVLKGGEFRSQMAIMSMEIFCCNRLNSNNHPLLPCPKTDPVQMVCWQIKSISYTSSEESFLICQGVICIKQNNRIGPLVDTANMELIQSLSYQKLLLHADNFPDGSSIDIVDNERQLFINLILVVRDKDPDFLVAYDIQRGSLG